MTSDAQEIKAHLQDRYWRLNNLYWIKDKSGSKVKFRMNWAQEKLHREKWYFNIILKARQLGFTTYIMIYFLDACLFNKNHAAGVIADTKENAQDLFENKVKFAYDNLPFWLRQEIAAENDSARQLTFSNGSSFSVGTSMRGGTLQKLLVSEFGKISAKYPEKAREIKTGALNTIEQGQQIFIESTAEGKMGEFFEFCKIARALADLGRQLLKLQPKFFFFAWFDNPEYTTDEEITISEEVEKKLRGLNLTTGQKAWYAAKASIMGDDMQREYPSTPDEAFEGSMEGAYYQKEMSLVRKQGQICHVPYDRSVPVWTFWDIGQGHDQMTILFYQLVRGRHNFIDYHESSDQGWEYYARLLAEKEYNYGGHRLPHDGKKRIVGAVVKTSEQIAMECGINPIVIVPRTKDVHADIRNFCKPVLPMCFFDESKCALLVQRLDNYRKKWDNINSMWLDEAVHDEASHGADGFRTFAMGKDTLTEETGVKSIMMGR